MLHTVYLITLSILMVESFFHEPSMKIFQAPTQVAEHGLFGYSISYQSSMKRMITSAPKGDDKGQIYTIDLLGSETISYKNCSFLDSKQSHTSINRNELQSMLLGASVAATDEFFVTCAPRYFEYKAKKRADNHKVIGNFGACGLESNNSGMWFLRSLKTVDRHLNTNNKVEKAMDTNGWSMDIKEPGDIVLIGGPAQHTGRVIVYEEATKPNLYPILINKYILPNDPVQFNFGYSIAHGNFFGDESIEYAISTTYGAVGYAKVYFFNTKYKHIFTITHDEIGTLFGANLCAVRLSEHYHYLLIGAPLYAKSAYESDTGAVYIYQPNSENSITLKKIIEATSPGGRFGLTMANLRDMDGDGKDEVAIAAPYEDDGAGAVYIYTGSALYNEADRYKMRIKPKQFRAFGLSLSAVWDYDDNGSNELAIGAPESNQIVLLRSFASITVELRTEFPHLQFESNKTVENMSFQVILLVHYPKKPKNITADIKVTVELTDGKSKFVDNLEENEKYTYVESLHDKLLMYNRSIPIQIVIPRQDVFPVVSYKISVGLLVDPMTEPFDPNRVLLSEESRLFEQDTKRSSRCTGTKCVPKLEPTLTKSLPDYYVIGSTQREYFNLSIHNSGDIAHAPCVKIEAYGVRILKASKDCVRSFHEEFICSPTLSILKGNTWGINYMVMEMNTLKSGDQNIRIKYDLYTHCDNDKTDKKTYDYSIQLYPESKFDIQGQSNPSDVITTTINELKEFQKQIKHVYTITNNGVTDWVDLLCQISFNNTNHINLLNSSALVYPESGAIQCALDHDSGEIFVCKFSLNRNQKAQLHVSIELKKNSFKKKDEDTVTKIVSELNIIANEKLLDTFLRLTTSVRINSTSVALWIIILSSLFGLLALLIIAFILYKFGFFRRNNRIMLKVLKEGYRQSMIAARQSENSELLNTGDCPNEHEIKD